MKQDSMDEALLPVQAYEKHHDRSESVESNGKGEGNSTPASAMFNQVNSILGSGILGLPFAAATMGSIEFCVFIAFFAICADYGLWLLLRASDMAKVKSYEEIGRVAMGKPGFMAASIAIILQNLGSMTTYMIVIGDIVPPLIHAALKDSSMEQSTIDILENRALIMAAVTTIFILPLVLLKSIGFLGYTSFLSLLIVLFFTISTFVAHGSSECVSLDAGDKAIQCFPQLVDGHRCGGDLFRGINLDTAVAMPTIAFSFMCHTASLPIYADLKKGHRRMMQRITHGSVSICAAMYIAASLVGYYTFYETVPGDLLKAYPPYAKGDAVYGLVNKYGDNLSMITTLMQTVRGAFAFAIVFTIPVVVYPMRKAVLFLIYNTADKSYVHHCVYGILITYVTMGIGIAVPQITDALGFVGATTATSLMFVFPALFFSKLRSRVEHHKARTGNGILAMVHGSFGVILGVTCVTFMVIGKIVTHAPAVPAHCDQ